ncbi:unnamed protein product [Phytomonas sp. EM1]|nr:unnamed protein product [Phytomonas sp. EM1]|eukprot:CCW62098.1 unnamed protein product [Phytomonas sp. isolate EM1]
MSSSRGVRVTPTPTRRPPAPHNPRKKARSNPPPALHPRLTTRATSSEAFLSRTRPLPATPGRARCGKESGRFSATRCMRTPRRTRAPSSSATYRTRSRNGRWSGSLRTVARSPQSVCAARRSRRGTRSPQRSAAGFASCAASSARTTGAARRPTCSSATP